MADFLSLTYISAANGGNIAICFTILCMWEKYIKQKSHPSYKNMEEPFSAK